MLSSKVIKFYSPISGNGIKAVDFIKKGEVLMVFEGKVISKDQADELYSKGFDYMLQIGPESFLYLEEDSKYVNHSCLPNSCFSNKEAELIALKDISPGEEISFDYSANENTEFSLNCECKNYNCRKLILPFEKNSNLVRTSLESILTPYIKKLHQT